jgi:nitrous oxidase accessory protein NosD
VRHPRLLPAVLCSAAALAALPAAASAVPTTIAASACAKFASTAGSDSASGSLAAPYRTAQKLVSSLASGQIGCLRGGTYAQDVTIANAGITLTAYQGEQATLVGRLWVKGGANGVTVTGLNIDGKNASLLPSPTINGNDDRFVGNDVTNEHTEICFIVGSSWGRAQRTLIQGNRIHGCGKLPSSNQDHAIYVDAADNTQILDNVIYDNVDRGVQLYPDAQGTVIRGNVIDGNGEGVIFSGANGTASSNTVVENNLITNSTIRSDIESWYPSGNPLGTNNVVRSNCLVPGVKTAINTSAGGFSASNDLVVSDAKYVNRGAGDFRLSSTSPCLIDVTGSTAPAGADWSPLSASSTSTTGSSGSTTPTGSTTDPTGSTTGTGGTTTGTGGTTTGGTTTGGTTTTSKGHPKKKLASAAVQRKRHAHARKAKRHARSASCRLAHAAGRHWRHRAVSCTRHRAHRVPARAHRRALR